jgi:uncharacterized membrane protein YcjF (UPF0283 family)
MSNGGPILVTAAEAREARENLEAATQRMLLADHDAEVASELATRAEASLRAAFRLVRAAWFVLAGALGALVGAAVIYWKAAP